MIERKPQEVANTVWWGGGRVYVVRIRMNCVYEEPCCGAGAVDKGGGGGDQGIGGQPFG